MDNWGLTCYPITIYMKRILSLYTAIFFLFLTAANVAARETSIMGMHVLNPEEFSAAKNSLLIDGETQDQWYYMTVPLTLNDLNDLPRWQKLFTEARETHVIPIVRLATRYENGSWQQPTRKDIVDLITFLQKLEWPTEDRHIIAFNEVNHSKEWGGEIDPNSYANAFRFTSSWAHAQQASFIVMPAAMDLAAPNGRSTSEAFNYLASMYAFDPEIFTYADAWNSHSYPNPGFSTSPTKTDKMSLRGFEHELAFLADKTENTLPVYITETGWEDSRSTRPWLSSYYEYALQHIWTKDKVVAVTPFIYKGSPGPFSGFSFMTADDKPTEQLDALRRALAHTFKQSRLLSSVESSR